MKFLNRFKLITTFKKKDIFESISGYSDEKWLLTQALNSEEPTHILLVGSPGLGKTRFLKAIEKYYPDLSYFALDSASTGAGTINRCFENPPRFLLIDEIEDMKQSDQATLLSLLQDGVLVETKVSRTRRLEFTCSVIATCNDTSFLEVIAIIIDTQHTYQKFHGIHVALSSSPQVSQWRQLPLS